MYVYKNLELGLEWLAKFTCIKYKQFLVYMLTNNFVLTKLLKYDCLGGLQVLLDELPHMNFMGYTRGLSGWNNSPCENLGGAIEYTHLSLKIHST